MFVRDFGSPNIIRKALFEEDITSKRDVHPGLCTYLEPDGSVTQQYVLDKDEPCVYYFSLNESALSEEELRLMLLKKYEDETAWAMRNVTKYSKLVLMLQK